VVLFGCWNIVALNTTCHILMILFSNQGFHFGCLLCYKSETFWLSFVLQEWNILVVFCAPRVEHFGCLLLFKSGELDQRDNRPQLIKFPVLIVSGTKFKTKDILTQSKG
jgi:hypothetical protein